MAIRVGSDFLVGGNDLRRTTVHTESVGRRARETKVATVMQTDVVWLSPDMPVRDARELMSRSDARIAVVVSARKRPMGVVYMDQLREEAEATPFDPDAPLLAFGVRGVRVSVGAEFHEDDGAPDHPVSDVMIAQVTDLAANASVARAAALMSLHGAPDLVVTDAEGRARGLVSASDIQRWVAAELDNVMAALAASVSAQETSSPSASSPPPERGVQVPGAGGASVLVVEDDGIIAAQLAEILEEEGYRVKRASDGRDALNALRDMTEKPRLILLDLMMPHMDGWEFRRAQLSDASLSAIPTVVMTAFSHAADMPELGSVAVLSKPLRLERLLDTVAQHCGQRARWN